MSYIQQIIFVAVIGIATYVLIRRVRFIRRNIKLGKSSGRNNDRQARLKNMLLVAFGQKKMFKRILPAVAHLMIYAGFLIINLEVLEFIIDGFTGNHRTFAPFLGDLYPVLMNVFEWLAFAVLVSCLIFLIRRNILRVKRFDGTEMTSWPKLDANLILIIEIILMVAIFTMNATDQVLQTHSEAYPETGRLHLSSLMIPLFQDWNVSALIFTERFAWWFHIIGILGFAIYITYSKHLHIFLAFPNTYYANLEAKGKIENMEDVTREVNIMLGVQPAGEISNEPPGRFGAKDVTDLTQVNLMNAYSCTECGRCTSECPANLTGKLLSPRKIMMDTRDRLEEVGMSIDSGGKGNDDGKSLLGNYITHEEINACTSCNACVEACPVNIDPLSIILQLRRYVAMEESGSPSSWNSMFQNIETSFSPWKFAPTDRFNWAEGIKGQDKSTNNE